MTAPGAEKKVKLQLQIATADVTAMRQEKDKKRREGDQKEEKEAIEASKKILKESDEAEKKDRKAMKKDEAKIEQAEDKAAKDNTSEMQLMTAEKNFERARAKTQLLEKQAR